MTRSRCAAAEANQRRTRKADVRDSAAMRAVVDDAVAEFGHVDIVCANAGIVSFGPSWELTDEAWQEMIDVNLTGVWKTIRPVVPHMIERGAGGSIILTSSTAGLCGTPNLAHYSSAKHGLVGLMRTLAVELAPHAIRVNSVHPPAWTPGDRQRPGPERYVTGVTLPVDAGATAPARIRHR